LTWSSYKKISTLLKPIIKKQKETKNQNTLKKYIRIENQHEKHDEKRSQGGNKMPATNEQVCKWEKRTHPPKKTYTVSEILNQAATDEGYYERYQTIRNFYVAKLIFDRKIPTLAGTEEKPTVAGIEIPTGGGVRAQNAIDAILRKKQKDNPAGKDALSRLINILILVSGKLTEISPGVLQLEWKNRPQSGKYEICQYCENNGYKLILDYTEGTVKEEDLPKLLNELASPQKLTKYEERVCTEPPKRELPSLRDQYNNFINNCHDKMEKDPKFRQRYNEVREYYTKSMKDSGLIKEKEWVWIKKLSGKVEKEQVHSREGQFAGTRAYLIINVISCIVAGRPYYWKDPKKEQENFRRPQAWLEAEHGWARIKRFTLQKKFEEINPAKEFEALLSDLKFYGGSDMTERTTFDEMNKPSNFDPRYVTPPPPTVRETIQKREASRRLETNNKES
jgi:hypothetical protein